MLAYFPDGKKAVTVHSRDLVTLWDVRGERPRSIVEIPVSIQRGVPGTTVCAVATMDSVRINRTEECDRFLVFLRDGCVIQWMYSSSQWHHWVEYIYRVPNPAHCHKIERAVLCGQGEAGVPLLAEHSALSCVRVWNLRTMKAVKLPKTQVCTHAIEFTPNGKGIAQAHDWGSVTVYRLSGMHAERVHVARISGSCSREHYALKFSPDASVLAVWGGFHGPPQLLQVNAMEESEDPKKYMEITPSIVDREHHDAIAIAFSPDSRSAAILNHNCEVVIVNAVSGGNVSKTQFNTYGGHRGLSGRYPFEYSPAGDSLAFFHKHTSAEEDLNLHTAKVPSQNDLVDPDILFADMKNAGKTS